MEVSVITVSFNSAATTGDTLASVADQTWPKIEHIVIDGGSTDTTLDIVCQRGSHLARVVSEPDSGIYDAMNKGVVAATGDIISVSERRRPLRAQGRSSRRSQRDGNKGYRRRFGDIVFFRLDPNVVVRRYCSARFRPDRIAWGWMLAHPSLFVRGEIFECGRAAGDSAPCCGG